MTGHLDAGMLESLWKGVRTREAFRLKGKDELVDDVDGDPATEAAQLSGTDDGRADTGGEDTTGKEASPVRAWRIASPWGGHEAM